MTEKYIPLGDELHTTIPDRIWPPDGIAETSFDLCGVTFEPNDKRRIERAMRDGQHIGDVLLDDNRFWFSRKPDDNGEWCDWKPMRCVHEARAFIVSRIKQ